MKAAVAVRPSHTKIARPLKVLIPLIQADLEHGDRAGMEYYADAGDKLIEAKPQVSFGHWGTWMRKNFALSQDTARVYMRVADKRAEQIRSGAPVSLPRSLADMRGGTARARTRRAAQRPLQHALSGVDTDLFTQEKQTREEEVRLHRELALELVDIGWKALATRLHPDRGGSTKAMTRLNRVHDELKGLAESRRFV